jgi:RHS repeat-associated protein
MEASRVDAYGYNARNELVTAAKLGGLQSSATEYQYDYDNIGNRVSSFELGTNYSFSANNRNQYAMVGRVVPNAPQEDFEPQYDADGNQTLVKTATGIWHVQYNGENQPVSWTCGETNVVMSYDRMGRRVHCMEIVGTATNRTDAFFYNDYLLVARKRSLADGASETDTFVWDPTEPVATRPLVLRRHGLQPRYYTHDGNKNVSELTSPEGTLSAHYEYSPFGSVVASSCQVPGFCDGNPFRFSSEYADDTLGLVCYNYRSYNPHDGRWLSRDPFGGSADNNGYLMCRNYPVGMIDVLGLWWTIEHRIMVKKAMDRIRYWVPCLTNDKAYETVVGQIADGNAHMDTEDKYADDLPLHYNRPMDNENYGEKMIEVNIEEAKNAYKIGLRNRRGNIDKYLKNSPTMKQCDDALEQMGQLTHMLQDYYGHGVDNNYRFLGNIYVSWLRVPLYSGNIGYSYGNPDSPVEDQMKPSSYSWPFSGSEHGGVKDLEPAHRAPDTAIRMSMSIIVTASTLQHYMKKWCEKCCKKIKAIEEAERRERQHRIDALHAGMSEEYLMRDMHNSYRNRTGRVSRDYIRR